MIVDDSLSNRKMMSRLLAKRHFQVDEAPDGLEALSRVRSSFADKTPLYDVIIMDFVMPNMDGPTATREIRALGYSGIIVGVTGNALAEDIDLFILSGANRVLPKPLEIEDFMNTLEGTILKFKFIASLISIISQTSRDNYQNISRNQ